MQDFFKKNYIYIFLVFIILGLFVIENREINSKMVEENVERVYSKKKKYNQIIDKILKNEIFF